MKKVSAFEKFAYSMGALGQNFVYGLMSSYLMIFYTDNFGISAAAVGTLFLVARLWDAVLDPCIGLFVDRVNTNWGKFRPFILIGGTLVGIMTVACFFNPQFGLVGKMIYAYITYIIWGTTFGIMDVPYWSMAPSMTVDPSERTHIISITKIASMIGVAFVNVLTIPMVKTFGNGDNSKGYFITAIIMGLICAGGAIFAAVNTKERAKVVVKEREKFIDSVNVVLQNGPLIIILLSSFFATTSVVLRQTVLTYYFTYKIRNMGLIPVFFIVGLIPMVLSMVVIPMISKRVGKRNTAIVGALLASGSSATMYFCASLLPLLFVFNAIALMGVGATMVLITSMQADTVEYAEWKTYKRSESIIFSFGTFTTKLASAFGGAIAGYLLTFVGYKPNVEQNMTSLNGINAMMTLAPAIGLLILAIILMFYKLTEKRHAEIVKEIDARQNLKN